jgi:cysteinyl-tRNA synthetase
MESARKGFLEAMDDDFNTAGALGHIFELVRAINQGRDHGVPANDLKPAQDLFRELTSVLGLRLDRTAAQGEQASPFIDLLLEIRQELRRQKLWKLSDTIRDRLAELGVLLEDSKEGTTWRWK